MHLICILFCLLILNGCDNQNARTTQQYSTSCIQKIISKDTALGKTRNHACEDTTLSFAIQEYVTGIRQLDFQQCPEAFTAAFAKHADAWMAALSVVDQYPNLRGEMHVLFDHLENGKDSIAFRPVVAKIWDTWAIVEGAME
ncbi:MAG: hypothetical protein AAFO94_14310 [Bacteroidota bacterium]